jgi:serine/threonine protein kinase
LGHGAQGAVDAIEVVTTRTRWARKTWRSSNHQSNKRFFKEISLLKRLDTQRHVIEVISTYSRGTQVGIVMTLADCDLSHVLSLPPDERRTFIPDDNLRKAYGCLSFSLSHMHDMGIRHKDIKPQNVLVRNGSLLFTDFDTSKDYSELTNSLTVCGTNTRRYAAPELLEMSIVKHQQMSLHSVSFFSLFGAFWKDGQRTHHRALQPLLRPRRSVIT